MYAANLKPIFPLLLYPTSHQHLPNYALQGGWHTYNVGYSRHTRNYSYIGEKKGLVDYNMGGEGEVQKFTKSFTFEVKSLNLKKYNAFAIITKSSVIKFHISTKHCLSLLYN